MMIGAHAMYALLACASLRHFDPLAFHSRREISKASQRAFRDYNIVHPWVRFPNVDDCPVSPTAGSSIAVREIPTTQVQSVTLPRAAPLVSVVPPMRLDSTVQAVPSAGPVVRPNVVSLQSTSEVSLLAMKSTAASSLHLYGCPTSSCSPWANRSHKYTYIKHQPELRLWRVGEIETLDMRSAFPSGVVWENGSRVIVLRVQRYTKYISKSDAVVFKGTPAIEIALQPSTVNSEHISTDLIMPPAVSTHIVSTDIVVYGPTSLAVFEFTGTMALPMSTWSDAICGAVLNLRAKVYRMELVVYEGHRLGFSTWKGAVYTRHTLALALRNRVHPTDLVMHKAAQIALCTWRDAVCANHVLPLLESHFPSNLVVYEGRQFSFSIWRDAVCTRRASVLTLRQEVQSTDLVVYTAPQLAVSTWKEGVCARPAPAQPLLFPTARNSISWEDPFADVQQTRRETLVYPCPTYCGSDYDWCIVSVVMFVTVLVTAYKVLQLASIEVTIDLKQGFEGEDEVVSGKKDEKDDDDSEDEHVEKTPPSEVTNANSDDEQSDNTLIASGDEEPEKSSDSQVDLSYDDKEISTFLEVAHFSPSSVNDIENAVELSSDIIFSVTVQKDVAEPPNTSETTACASEEEHTGTAYLNTTSMLNADPEQAESVVIVSENDDGKNFIDLEAGWPLESNEEDGMVLDVENDAVELIPLETISWSTADDQEEQIFHQHALVESEDQEDLSGTPVPENEAEHPNGTMVPISFDESVESRSVDARDVVLEVPSTETQAIGQSSSQTRTGSQDNTHPVQCQSISPLPTEPRHLRPISAGSRLRLSATSFVPTKAPQFVFATIYPTPTILEPSSSHSFSNVPFVTRVSIKKALHEANAVAAANAANAAAALRRNPSLGTYSPRPLTNPPVFRQRKRTRPGKSQRAALRASAGASDGDWAKENGEDSVW